MDERTLKVLEYNKIISIIEGYACSDLGKSAVRSIRPSFEKNRVMDLLNETTEAQSIISYLGYSPMDTFQDINLIIKKIRIGAILSLSELLAVASISKLIARVKERISEYPDKSNIPIIKSSVDSLIQNKAIMDEIYRCIENEEKVSDYASNKLASIRRNILRVNERIRERLNKLVYSPSYQKYLQETIVTIRNGRYVVPVKQEYRSLIPGMIHDQSTSGATLFIEPMAVVEANNQLKELILEEEREIDRILLELTLSIEPHCDSISNNLKILAKLDMIFAKGLYSHKNRAISPRILDDPHIKIIDGRHPLINKDDVVAISVELKEDTRSLIITGPNTGGKTVTLKTIGLFVLMAQSGIHIFSAYGSEIGIFDGIYADIGDEQSIEQSLSTFSSHMVHIAQIVDRANPRSLVLFDELGAGTDPVEGAALAMSILSYFLDKGTITIATTHYSELKAFALLQEGMENASMEFDVVSLKPTFKLSIGMPGKSNAFEISRRLGLREELIEDARSFLSKDEIRLQELLTEIEENRAISSQDRIEADSNLREIQELKIEIKEKNIQLEKDRDKIIEDAKTEALNILKDAKVEADNHLNNLKKSIKNIQTMEEAKELDRIRKDFNKPIQELEKLAKEEKKLYDMERGLDSSELKLGQSVHVKSLNKKGQILEISDNSVLVQVGIMKINIDPKDLSISKVDNISKPLVRTSFTRGNKRVSLELDLRGQNIDEAIQNIDSYLDDVFLSGLEEVVLIHGKGTGALRKGIQDHLRNHPHVNSYRLGKFGEGESGVTVVKLN